MNKDIYKQLTLKIIAEVKRTGINQLSINRHIEIFKKDFPSQFDRNVVKCAGFNIIWV